jgi:hypothetical protein
MWSRYTTAQKGCGEDVFDHIVLRRWSNLVSRHTAKESICPQDAFARLFTDFVGLGLARSGFLIVGLLQNFAIKHYWREKKEG